MLSRRILTALALIFGILWLVWLAPRGVVPVAFAAIVMIGAWEWAFIATPAAHTARVAYTLVILGLLFGGWLWLRAGGSALPMLVAGVLWWLTAPVYLVSFVRNPSRRVLSHSISGLIGVVVLVAFWFAIVAIYSKAAFGPYWVTMLLLLVWGSDTGGYIAGRAWGRHKLLPQVSPGKTWEGAIGSLILGMIGGGAYYACGRLFGFAPAGVSFLLFLGLALVTIVIAIAGDLFESMLKRQRGIKDSGGLLPGHGGILDRIDSLLAAAPVLALGVRGIS